MHIVEYAAAPDPALLEGQLACCPWDAGTYLLQELQQGTFLKNAGGWGRIFFLLDGDTVVSFMTLSAQDCMTDPALTPWVGFVFTWPAYRGRGYMQTLMEYTLEQARKAGAKQVYLASECAGLYEKLGFAYVETRRNDWGQEERLYVRRLEQPGTTP